jgi:Transcriptional regulator, AbiEi antitoxin, Type IV TA system
MQASVKSIEREARRRIPGLLAELLDEDSAEMVAEESQVDSGVDLLARDSEGRSWAFEIKASGGPGQIDRAAGRLKAFEGTGAIPVLVVPYMSKAGAETAERMDLNWIDLAGNAGIREEGLRVWVRGKPNELRTAGRPSSPFAPKSARVSRMLLLEPKRWWRQKDLVVATQLDDGNISRIVRRLDEEALLERRDKELRPRDPDLLLDAWAQEYRFDRHDAIAGHVSGSGIEVARNLAGDLSKRQIEHAFTGLPAAWAIDRFARFRLTTVYVDGDPRDVVEQLDVRQGSKGANVQILGPDDTGVFAGKQVRDDLRCVSTVQVYLDLLQLPERSTEAAQHLRDRHLDWHGRSR